MQTTWTIFSQIGGKMYVNVRFKILLKLRLKTIMNKDYLLFQVIQIYIVNRQFGFRQWRQLKLSCCVATSKSRRLVNQLMNDNRFFFMDLPPNLGIYARA